LCAVTALVVGVAARPGERALAVCVCLVGVGLPVTLGLVRLRRRRDDRFAWLLVATASAWTLTTLARSDDPTLYSIGRTAVWLIEPAVIFLLLSFPYGRLTARPDRRLFGSVAVVAGLLYLPTVFLAPFPHPSPYSSCEADCPANAFVVGHGAPTLVADVVRPLREVLTVVLFAAVGAVLVHRARWASPMMRRAVAPVAAIAIFRAAAVPAYDIARAAGGTDTVLDVAGWLYLLSLPLLTIAFAAGLLGERLFVASALERLALSLKPHSRATELRSAMAEALQDPALRILYWVPGDPGRWVDETGWPVKPPRQEGERASTEVAVGGRRVAAIVHDVSLARDPALIEAATSYALAALENERLVEQLESSLDELSKSRTRLVTVADQERRRIERDLHDGAQQRLVALRARLQLVAEQVNGNSAAGAAAIQRLDQEVETTIDEVRSFARGVYPSLLVQRGLAEALRAAGRSAPIPTIVDADRIGRYPPEIEATVYFACMEALQNVAKHARGARGAVISVSRNPHLRFEVRDDGAGFRPSDVGAGSGLTNLRDRLAAVGGELDVKSAPGRGTRVAGVIEGV
jgi:signal transduction histidine kinase